MVTSRRYFEELARRQANILSGVKDD